MKKYKFREESVTYSSPKEAAAVLTNIISFMGRKVPNEKLVLKMLSEAVVDGLFTIRDMGEEDLVKKDAMYLCSLIKSADYSSSDFEDEEF